MWAEEVNVACESVCKKFEQRAGVYSRKEQVIYILETDKAKVNLSFQTETFYTFCFSR
jgi:hypothetical protein